jgi:antirestriction protein ArdC
MREHTHQQQPAQRPGLYQEITDKIIAQIEAGILPWAQPWAGGPALSMPVNATTHRSYSGINILLLWDALFQRGFDRNRWLTFKQALSVGGNVRKGEHGTTVVFADRFTPKGEQEAPSGKEGEARSIPFLKRFTVFNIAQCEGLPAEMTATPAPVSHRFPIESAEFLIQASGAVFQRGGEQAYYHTGGDYIRVPEQDSFFEPINFYRTALHELTHWSGAKHRLDRDSPNALATKPMPARNWSQKWVARFFAPPWASCRPPAMPTISAIGSPS